MLRILVLALVMGACDDGGRTRDPSENPDGAVDGDATLDAARPDPDDGVEPDVGADAALDEGVVDDGALSDASPDAAPTPEVCNGEDDDQDGLIDEGVSNVCGGCGGIPVAGCQAWRVDLTQTEAGTLIPDRTVGLLGTALGVSEVDIDNAHCTFIRVPAQDPEGHIGQVNIDAPDVSLNLGPVFDERQGVFRYLNTPELGATHLHDPDDDVEIRSGGGRLVGPFTETLRSPALVHGLTGDHLLPVIALARGESEDPVTLRWDAPDAPTLGTLRFFIGGSVPLFTNVFYRAIRHYQLDAVLEDDGELTVGPELFAGGVPASSIRVYVARDTLRRRVLGPHAVQLRIGHKIEAALGGRLEGEDEPPFQFLTPSPNERVVIPGDPLEVTWSPLPEGEGPLTLTLTLYDSVALEQRQYACEITDPALGAVTLPGDFTEGWPRNQGDLRQIALRYDVGSRALAAPDTGAITESLSLLLTLDGCQEDPQCGAAGSICDRGGCRAGCREDGDCADGLVCGATQTCMAP